MTVAELRKLLNDWPDEHPLTGEPSEVWVQTGENLSSIASGVFLLDASDLLIEANAFHGADEEESEE